MNITKTFQVLFLSKQNEKDLAFLETYAHNIINSNK